MGRKLLYVASSYIHILNFHLPYLRALHEQGWELHVGCASPEQEFPWADRTLSFPFEKKMSSLSNFRAAAQIRRLVRRNAMSSSSCIPRWPRSSRASRSGGCGNDRG